ncbi:hypothetical protein H6G81_07135 [Scytonema hofmannii FACHB-248]|uniref:Uncharacterized protein n=1 Tax=Scytonema hofmannii FACHB-248 TaxID=1842502 RepID=A0ABR8GM76_9CYAN|nr:MULTISPECIES: hypothetical protein [Nostocales]MBD2604312.1 hypothetical protein [Scytonema hofmannii FACHB-248]
MTEIRIEIEGEDAIAATNALLEIPGISGYAEVPEAPEREGTLATVAAIFTIAGVTVQIVEQFCKWYEKYKGQQPTIEKVVIFFPNGQRLLLITETINDETKITIAKIIDDYRQK